MRIDPYNHERKYKNWKRQVGQDGIPGLSRANSDLILRYLNDMELGLNVAKGSVKGARSYTRLNTLRTKLIFFSDLASKEFGLDCLTNMASEQIVALIQRMRNGEIKTRTGRRFKSAGYYASVFKAFWHWHQTVSRKEGVHVPDITVDLDTRDSKPTWVYLTEEQVRSLAAQAKFNYRVLILFIFDSGLRSPGELVNVRVQDLSDDCRVLHVREETSKTFGRKIKLMLSSALLKEYIQQQNLEPQDRLFRLKPYRANQYLKRLAARVLGDGLSQAGKRFSELTMYDLRHCSCCYWLPRYKSESALKYRFGWKKSDKIYYYSEMLGMRDTIADEDLLLDTSKTELERQLGKTEQERSILQERVEQMEAQMRQILLVVEQMARSETSQPPIAWSTPATNGAGATPATHERAV